MSLKKLLTKASLGIALAVSPLYSSGCGDDSNGSGFFGRKDPICTEAKEMVQVLYNWSDAMKSQNPNLAMSFCAPEEMNSWKFDQNSCSGLVDLGKTEWSNGEEYYIDFKNLLPSGRRFDFSRYSGYDGEEAEGTFVDGLASWVFDNGRTRCQEMELSNIRGRGWKFLSTGPGRYCDLPDHKEEGKELYGHCFD